MPPSLTRAMTLQHPRIHQKLRRCSSALIRRQSRLPQQASLTTKAHLPQLPVEILEAIIESLLLSSESETESPFHAFRSLSVASKVLRELSFRVFLSQIHLTKFSHLVSIFMLLDSIPQVVPYVKYCIYTFDASVRLISHDRILSAPSFLLLPHSDDLAKLYNMRELSINFVADGLATQRFTCERIFKELSGPKLHHLSTLSLHHMCRIRASLLALIADTFPFLDTLILSCTERLELTCCVVCLEES